MLFVEVAYATPARQFLVAVHLPDNSVVQQAIDASGVLTEFPELDLAQQATGIFGKRVPLTQLLKTGDRIEIYRPLTLDPKQARRLRALKKT